MIRCLKLLRVLTHSLTQSIDRSINRSESILERLPQDVQWSEVLNNNYVKKEFEQNKINKKIK